MSQTLPLEFLRLRIITPRKLLVDEDVQEITLPGVDGYLGILPGHRQLIISLGEGEVAFQMSGRKEHYSVRGGYAEISPDKVIIFTEIGKEEESDESAKG